MPQPKTYTGGCHCGMVRFECTAEPDGTEVVALNVSCIDGIELAKFEDDADRRAQPVR